MPNYRTCIFCNRNDSPPSREHIFANWIAKEFPEPTSSTWESIYLGTSIKFKTKNKIGFTSSKVCRRCNNEWMAKLERATKPAMSPLIHGSRVVLDWDRQLCIAKWFMKTVLMCDALAKDKSFFTTDQRKGVMSGLAPSITTWIFLACYRGPHIGELTTRSVFIYGEEKSPDNQDDLLDSDRYTFTLLIKHLALQVFSFRRPKELKGTFKLSIPARWAPVTVQIPVEGDVIWPPRLVLDDKGFEEFATRWGELGLIG